MQMYYIFKEETQKHLFREFRVQYFVYFRSYLLCSSWNTLEQCIQNFTDYYPMHTPDFNTAEINMSELIIQGKELVGIFDYPPTLDNIIEFNPELLL